MRVKERRTRTITDPTGKVVSAEQYEHELEVRCDRCNDLIGVGLGSYDVLSVTIEAREGESYPEGSNTMKWSPDVCMDCFKGHVMPALAAIGISAPWEDDSW